MGTGGALRDHLATWPDPPLDPTGPRAALADLCRRTEPVTPLDLAEDCRIADIAIGLAPAAILPEIAAGVANKFLEWYPTGQMIAWGKSHRHVTVGRPHHMLAAATLSGWDAIEETLTARRGGLWFHGEDISTAHPGARRPRAPAQRRSAHRRGVPGLRGIVTGDGPRPHPQSGPPDRPGSARGAGGSGTAGRAPGAIPGEAGVLLPGWSVNGLWALGLALSTLVAITDALLGSRALLRPPDGPLGSDRPGRGVAARPRRIPRPAGWDLGQRTSHHVRGCGRHGGPGEHCSGHHHRQATRVILPLLFDRSRLALPAGFEGPTPSRFVHYSSALTICSSAA